MVNTTACVVVNYNDSQRTLSLLNAIKKYDSLDYLIVVDNCSTDDSIEVLNTFDDAKYYLIKSTHNGGYGYGNNLGAKKAELLGAKYILIANPDVMFDDKCVSSMKMVLMQNTSCGIVGAKEVHMGVSGWKYTSAIHDVLSASLFFNKLLKKRYYPSNYFEGCGVVEVNLVPGCLLLLDLKKFMSVGMYDESVFLYEEEKILYKKMSDAGYKSYVDLDVSYQHLHKESHPKNIRSIVRGRKRLLASRLLFLKKYRHFGFLLMFFSRLFFSYALFEMFVYSIFLKTKKSLT